MQKWQYDDVIKNVLAISEEHPMKRTVESIFDHAQGEMFELHFEIEAQRRGIQGDSDGISGEAIDVILCMIDLIRVANPEMSMEDVFDFIKEYSKRKSQKWVEKYS